MRLEESLRAALVGWVPSVAGRVYPLAMPQLPTFPALTYQRNGGRRLRTQEGETGLCRTLMQVDAWGNSYAEVKQAIEEVRLGLDRHRPQSVLCNGGPVVGGFHLDDEADDYHGETNTFRCSLQFAVWHEEPLIG